MDADFWNTRYRESERIWSGDPNPQLVAEASPLIPGTALDAGCGEGADALWLARRGWHVTAVDFASAALDKGEAEAKRQGLDERITWLCEDLTSWRPDQEFDLVSAQFFHLTSALRDQGLRNLASVVGHGGSFLVVGHNRQDVKTHTGHERHAEMLFNPSEVEVLLDPEVWRIQVSEARDRVVDAEGEPFTYVDTVVHAVRR